MSRYDALQEHHRQRVLRALPRYHAVEGPYSAPTPPTPLPERLIVVLSVIGLLAWFVLDVLPMLI